MQTTVEKEHNNSKTPRESIFVPPCKFQNPEKELEILQQRTKKQFIINTQQVKF